MPLPSPVGPPARVGVRWVTGDVRRRCAVFKRLRGSKLSTDTPRSGSVPDAFPGAILEGWAGLIGSMGLLFEVHKAGQRGNKDEQSESASFTFGR